VNGKQIVTTPTQPKLNTTKVGLDTKMTLHQHQHHPPPPQTQRQQYLSCSCPDCNHTLIEGFWGKKTTTKTTT